MQDFNSWRQWCPSADWVPMLHPATRPVFPHLGNLCKPLPLHLAWRWDRTFVSSSVKLCQGPGCVHLLLLHDRDPKNNLLNQKWKFSKHFRFVIHFQMIKGFAQEGRCNAVMLQYCRRCMVWTFRRYCIYLLFIAFSSALFCKFCQHQACGTACSNLMVFHLACQLRTTLHRTSTHVILPAWTLFQFAEMVPLVRSILIVHVKVK